MGIMAGLAYNISGVFRLPHHPPSLWGFLFLFFLLNSIHWFKQLPTPGELKVLGSLCWGAPKPPEKPQRVKGQVSPWDLPAVLRRKAPSGELA